MRESTLYARVWARPLACAALTGSALRGPECAGTRVLRQGGTFGRGCGIGPAGCHGGDSRSTWSRNVRGCERAHERAVSTNCRRASSEWRETSSLSSSRQPQIPHWSQENYRLHACNVSLSPTCSPQEVHRPRLRVRSIARALHWLCGR